MVKVFTCLRQMGFPELLQGLRKLGGVGASLRAPIFQGLGTFQDKG